MKENLEQTNLLVEPDTEEPMYRIPSTDFPGHAPAAPQEARRPVRLSPSKQSAVPRILVVTDSDPIAETVREILRRNGLVTERARSMLEALEAAYSGRFAAVVTTPSLKDGSWKHLAGVAEQVRPRFVVIVVARTFSLHDWAEALDDGAFDVVDELSELPDIAVVVRHALLTEYLLGERPDLQIPGFWRPS